VREAKVKVTNWADINGVPTLFRVMNDSERTEYGRFPSEAEANAFLQGFLAGQANWNNLDGPADPADLSATTEPAI
jgi:hypothetical protein